MAKRTHFQKLFYKYYPIEPAFQMPRIRTIMDKWGAVFAVGTASPWIAVAGGLVTVGIGVYSLANE